MSVPMRPSPSRVAGLHEIIPEDETCASCGVGIFWVSPGLVRRGHWQHRRPRDDEAAFWAKVDRSGGPEACWPWTAGLVAGYGQTRVHGRSARANRMAWSYLVGAIPDGLFVCHRCDNRGCCNPAHMFLGTNADNMRDAATKGRMFGQWKLTPDEARTIRTSTGPARIIAARYGISLTTVYTIRHGARYLDRVLAGELVP